MGTFRTRVIFIVLVFIFVSSSAFTRAGDSKVPTSITQSKPPFQIVSGSLCLSRGIVPPEEMHWLYIPASASELHTELNYLYLAGQLIANGVVDASSCPVGGMGEGGYANACGMAVAQPLVIELQNAYDESIMDAWRNVGVPPVMLKQLIRYESQFWPTKWGYYHFGLGHLTFFGARTALLWNPVLFQAVCDVAYHGNCQNVTVDDIMVGTFLNFFDAACPTCPMKIDIGKAQQSVYYLSQALMAYCRQSTQIIYNVTEGKTPSTIVSYSTIWKLTLYNYNAGAVCVYNSIEKAYGERRRFLRWSDIEDNTESKQCLVGIDYANKITEKFYNFPPP